MTTTRRLLATAALICGWIVAVVVPAADPGRPVATGDALLADDGLLESTATRDQRRLIRSVTRGPSGDDRASITIDYPLEDSVFPPDMVAPTFLWHDAAIDVDGWVVDISLRGGRSHVRVVTGGHPPPEGEIDERCIAVTNELYTPTPYQASAISWKPSRELWELIKRESVDRPATLTWYGYRAGTDRAASRGSVEISTSRDPVGAPIFYRDVPLMPAETKEGVIKPLDQSAQPLIAWRLRDVSRTDSRVMLRDMPTCGNCHSFSADGTTFGMDVDGPDGDKGAYAIAPVERDVVIDDEQVMTWNAFPGKPRFANSLGFMSRLSPDGRYAVSTVNEAVYVNNFKSHDFIQVFYPTRGILAVHDREHDTITALPGADDPEFVHCSPVWTPDGKTLIFSRARARDPYERGAPLARYAGDPAETPIRYDLYRMPFNESRGGTPQPIAGASDNGMSNSFPKVSPDGRWIVFVKASNGLLMRPDSTLWIVPLEGGEARPLRSNLRLMNSWHSFSPNGRWLVFSSKANTPYTQMFLTHIDEAGNSTPAILIENSTAANRAVNIPEFVNTDYDGFESISVPAVDHHHFFRRGREALAAGRLEEAVRELERALAGEPEEWRFNDWKIHDTLSKGLLALGDSDRALEHVHRSLEINPLNTEMRANAGYLLAQSGRIDEALEQLDIALRIQPRDPQLWYNRATIHLERGDRDRTVADYTEAIRLRPGYAAAYSGRGTALMNAGDLTAALADFDQALKLDAANPAPWYFRALIRQERGDVAGALDDAERGLEVAPAGSPQAAALDALRLRLLAR